MKSFRKFFQGIFSNHPSCLSESRTSRKYGKLVRQIKALADQYASLSNDDLRAEADRLWHVVKAHRADLENKIADKKQALANYYLTFEEGLKLRRDLEKLETLFFEHLQEKLVEILPEGFAIVKETARRFANNPFLRVVATDTDKELAESKSHILITEDGHADWQSAWMVRDHLVSWKMDPFDTQILAGIVLFEGKIAEMANGEGKTLAAIFPAFLTALGGRGAHVVTINDYLSKRDSEWMAPLFEFHGFRVDCIENHKPHSEQRQSAYKAYVVYGTASEFCFDYLRDNIVLSLDETVQTEPFFAIIDEVDSILIDDGRTPVIISGPDLTDERGRYMELKPYAERLMYEQEKVASQAVHEIKRLLSSRENESATKFSNLLLLIHLGFSHFKPFQKLIAENSDLLLLLESEKTTYYSFLTSQKQRDDFENQLFFVHPPNNQIQLTQKGALFLAQDSSEPNAFLAPNILEELERLESQYNGKTRDEDFYRFANDLKADYQTKKQKEHCLCQLLKAYLAFQEGEHYVVAPNEIVLIDQTTGRPMDGRRYSDGLHQAIEVKEGIYPSETTTSYAIITQKNYFKRYRKLAAMTATAKMDAREYWDVFDLAIAAIPTRIAPGRKDENDQVYKTKREKFDAIVATVRDYKQKGRPVLVATPDDTNVADYLSRLLLLNGIPHNLLNAKNHQQEAEIIVRAGMASAVTVATKMAGRGTDIVLSQSARQAGGLAVVGVERFDSRRVDLQFKGRAGRQGNPGTSIFFVSLEDNLMKLFQSQRIANLMDKMGHREGDVIEHSMVTRSIDRAQNKVNENNYITRSRLYHYDDILEFQRKEIYGLRQLALKGYGLEQEIEAMFGMVAEKLVEENSSDYLTFRLSHFEVFGENPSLDEKAFAAMKKEEIVKRVFTDAFSRYEEKTTHISSSLFPTISDVHERERQRYLRIAVPVAIPGCALEKLAVNMANALSSKGLSIRIEIEQGVLVKRLDEHWKKHLKDLDELKEDIGNTKEAIMEDPHLFFAANSSGIFETMFYQMKKDIVMFLAKCQLAMPQSEPEPRRIDLSELKKLRSEEEEE